MHTTIDNGNNQPIEQQINKQIVLNVPEPTQAIGLDAESLIAILNTMTDIRVANSNLVGNIRAIGIKQEPIIPKLITPQNAEKPQHKNVFILFVEWHSEELNIEDTPESNPTV